MLDQHVEVAHRAEGAADPAKLGPEGLVAEDRPEAPDRDAVLVEVLGVRAEPRSGVVRQDLEELTGDEAAVALPWGDPAPERLRGGGAVRRLRSGEHQGGDSGVERVLVPLEELDLDHAERRDVVGPGDDLHPVEHDGDPPVGDGREDPRSSRADRRDRRTRRRAGCGLRAAGRASRAARARPASSSSIGPSPPGSRSCQSAWRASVSQRSVMPARESDRCGRVVEGRRDQPARQRLSGQIREPETSADAKLDLAARPVVQAETVSEWHDVIPREGHDVIPREGIIEA